MCQLLRVSNADGVMLGRGAVQDPLIFRRIAATVSRDERGVVRVSDDVFEREFEVELVIDFLRALTEVFKAEAKRAEERGSGVIAQELETFKVGKLKSIVKYLFAGNPMLLPHMDSVMRMDPAGGREGRSPRIRSLVATSGRRRETYRRRVQQTKSIHVNA